jgi:hypothetical protein
MSTPGNQNLGGGPGNNPGGPAGGPGNNPGGPAGGPGNNPGGPGGINPGGNQINIFDTVLNYDPSDPAQIPQTNRQLADLICYRLDHRARTGFPGTTSIANLFAQDTEVNIIAKEKISSFIRNNPDLPSYGQARVVENKMVLGTVSCSPGSSLVRALRVR